MCSLSYGDVMQRAPLGNTLEYDAPFQSSRIAGSTSMKQHLGFSGGFTFTCCPAPSKFLTRSPDTRICSFIYENRTLKVGNDDLPGGAHHDGERLTDHLIFIQGLVHHSRS